MCGIVGIVDFAARPIDEAAVSRMCERLSHRGPDAQGIRCFPGGKADASPSATAALGHRRLSIIDVAGGHQPIANEDGTIWTVLNGEIYNFQLLHGELERRGHRFATRSDTEVIVHLYEEYGEEFVTRLEGMFALALWDQRAHRLILARDRVGKKPLLYAEVGPRLLFASEFQALLADPAISRDIDPEALDYYLNYLAIPAPFSIYRGIRKLPPAHLLIRDPNGTRLQRYWSLPYEPKWDMDETEAVERVRELLEAAVRKRLVSEVPLGAFLSGGVDSSVVVALMSQMMGERVKTFSIGFDNEHYNELPYAQRIAEHFGCDHHAFVVQPSAISILPTLIEHFGEPFADSSAIPTYYLAQLTRQHVTVALNGDGGDEAFAGYGRHLANRLAESWQRSPWLVREPANWMSRQLLPNLGDSRAWPSRLRRFVDASALSRPDRYRRWSGLFSGELKAALIGKAAGFSADHGLIERFFGEVESLNAVDAALAVDTAFYLPSDLLVKMDIMTMANSLEARSPFLDHQLMEFVARLPNHLKLRHLTAKYLLKRAFAGQIPRAILHRRKSGFAVPMGQWFRTELRGFLCDHLLSSRIAHRGLVRQAVVTELVTQHLHGRLDYTHHLWSLLVLELWYRRFVELS